MRRRRPPDDGLDRLRERGTWTSEDVEPKRRQEKGDSRSRIVIRYYHEHGIEDIEGSSRDHVAERSLAYLRDLVDQIRDIAARARGLCAWARESDPSIPSNDELDGAIETIEAVGPIADSVFYMLPRVRDRVTLPELGE